MWCSCHRAFTWPYDCHMSMNCGFGKQKYGPCKTFCYKNPHGGHLLLAAYYQECLGGWHLPILRRKECTNTACNIAGGLNGALGCG